MLPQLADPGVIPHARAQIRSLHDRPFVIGRRKGRTMQIQILTLAAPAAPAVLAVVVAVVAVAKAMIIIQRSSK